MAYLVGIEVKENDSMNASSFCEDVGGPELIYQYIHVPGPSEGHIVSV